MRTCFFITFACLVLTTLGRAQDRPGENAAAARIAEGVEKVRAGQLLDAVEQFQRVLDTAGDDLVLLDRHQYVPARWVVHGHLSRLPAEGVKLYRQRIDGQAAKRLEEAKKSRSDAGLNRVLADMFVSRAAEEAILELARRAFERGEFDAAEHFWRMLLPGDDSALHYPDPKTPPAAVLARLVLVKLFQGERADAAAGLALLKEKHPNEAGLLAGRTGKYVETLTDLMARPAETTLPRPPDERDWPTFGGSPGRTGTTRARLPYFWPDIPTWRISLPLLRPNRANGTKADPLHPKALAFHPIVVDGRAFVADGARVWNIDLMTGQSATAAWVKDGVDTVVPSATDVRHTLTAADGIVYARMGPAAMKAPAGSFIAAFGKKLTGDGWEELWRLSPPAVEGTITHFEGTPLVRGGHVYAAVWQQAGAQAATSVACYRIDDPRTAPELAWQRSAGRAATEPNGETRHRHDLLSLAGPNVIYLTHGGTVIALDAATGRPAWEYRYPRDERPTLLLYRDLCPPVVDGGRIYVAPADTDRLMCLDAYTGRLIWERETIEVVHLLGVAKGRLIATIGGQLKGIRGFNLRTGADSGANGWTIHDDGGASTFGRGLVSDEAVVWPTRHGLYFLNPADGTSLREPIRTPERPDPHKVPGDAPSTFGNLCFADGCLIVTTATDIWGYPTEAKKLGDRRKAAEAVPADPMKHAALAQSLIDAGALDAAEQAVANSGSEGDRLRWLLAERLIRAGEKQRALSQFKLLSTGKSVYAPAAAVRRAEQAADREQAREAWRSVANKGGSVRDGSGVPWPALAYAESRFGDVLYMHGLGLRPFGLSREGPPPTILARTGSKTTNDPATRILGMSDQGIVAIGDRLRIAPGGGEVRLDWKPVTGAFTTDSDVCCADSVRVRFFRSSDGQPQPYRELSLAGPRLNDPTHPAFPSASGTADNEALNAYQFDDWTIGFRYGDRAIASAGVYSCSTLVTPATSTAGFFPVFGQSADYLLGQLTNGRMLIRGPADKVPREYPASRRPWPEPPLYAGDGRFLVADDSGLTLHDAKSWATLATYSRSRADSSTGELMRVRLNDDYVLALVPRNHGTEIDRLKLADLKRVWPSGPVLVGRELSDVAFTEDNVVVAADGSVTAYRWATGERAWDAPLPESRGIAWKLTVAPTGLTAYPAEALRTTVPPDPTDELRRGGWLGPGLLRLAGRSYHHCATRELPVLVFDPADGRLVQRLTFPALGPAAGVAVSPTGAVVVTGAGSWTLSAR
jgi:outer membrane protein assembly factor BamB